MYGNIELNNAPNGIIENSLIFGGDSGVSMISSHGTRIENCTITETDWRSIYVGSSNGVSIIDVEASYCSSNAIAVFTSDHVLIQNSTVFNSTYEGIYLGSGNYGVVQDCTVYNSGQSGIETRAQHSLITGNDIHNNGWFQPTGSHGIQTINAYNCTILDNDIYENPSYGINLLQSNTCNVTSNRIHDNDYGIGTSQSPDVEISHNRIFNNGWVTGDGAGIFIGWSSGWVVNHNWISNNTRYGIDSYLSNGSRVEYNEVFDNEFDNLYFRNSHHCNFTGNTIGGSGTGLYLIDSIDARIIDNIIYDGSSFGLQLLRSSSCWIYLNDLAWNEYDVWNAREMDCVGIMWDDNESVGNWWGDYDGSPTYVLQYGDGGVDHFPHLSLNASEAAPIEYEFGSAGHVMNWTQASARNPSHYEVYADGVLFENMTWNGLHIEVNVDSLDFGYHEMNLTVFHITGHSASSISYANVTDTTAPTWDVPPINPVIEFGDAFNYNVSASDLRGIHHYWVNDTTYYNVSLSGQITNTSQVPVGIYDLEIRGYDPSDLYCSAFITITVSDTIHPTWNLTIENQILEYGEVLSYLLGATDISGIGIWLVNDTAHFTVVDGLVTNITTLEAGIYYLNVSVQDIYGNTLYEIFSVTVMEPPTPTTTPIPTTPTTTTPTTPTTSPTQPPDGGPDTTLLLIGGLGAALVIIVVLVVVSKKRGE
jgi:parallel beta-helix repeat protein